MVWGILWSLVCRAPRSCSVEPSKKLQFLEECRRDQARIAQPRGSPPRYIIQWCFQTFAISTAKETRHGSRELSVHSETGLGSALPWAFELNQVLVLFNSLLYLSPVSCTEWQFLGSSIATSISLTPVVIATYSKDGVNFKAYVIEDSTACGFKS